MAIGHEFSSSMKLAILLLMTTLFLYWNVDTSFLILRRNVSALFTFRCCLRERCNHFLTLPSMSSVSRTLRRKKQNRTLFMVWWRGGIVVECHSRLQNFEGRWFLSYMLWSAIFNSKHAIKLDIMDNKKTITSSSAMLDLWSRKTRAMKSCDNQDVAERRRFRKVPFLKCSPSTLIRLAGVCKFFQSGERFREGPFSMENFSGSVRISVDGRRNRKNKFIEGASDEL